MCRAVNAQHDIIGEFDGPCFLFGAEINFQYIAFGVIIDSQGLNVHSLLSFSVEVYCPDIRNIVIGNNLARFIFLFAKAYDHDEMGEFRQ